MKIFACIVGWIALSFVVAILIGKFIHAGSGDEE